MSNYKQSSVEWYSVKRDVLEIEVRLGKLSANEYAEELAKAEQQAKAMHKEEIIDANFDAQPFREYTMTDSRKISEQYYKGKFDK